MESCTPPAHDSIPAFTSEKYPARSPARCDWDGLCASDTSTQPATSTMMTPKTHSGVRRVAQPVCRSGTKGGSVFVGESTGFAPRSFMSRASGVHEGDALG